MGPDLLASDSRHVGQSRLRKIAIYVGLISLLLLGRAAPGETASWTTLKNLPLDWPGMMILLTDGTVMVQQSHQGWMKLTPDSTGSYINGTWSSLASMGTSRLYFASTVLTSGKVWVLGGEYTGNPWTGTETNTGEMYDPVSDAWSPIATYPLAHFGDNSSMLLPNGQILAEASAACYIYNIATDSWSFGANKFYSDSSSEESWAKLPDGTVLMYDLWHSIATNGQYAERYNPSTNSWSGISPSDGTAKGFIPQLSSYAVSAELGPLLRLQDGRILVVGATGHTALYTLSTNTWAAGPDIMGTINGVPALFGADDAPGAVLPNGHVLFVADAGPSAVTSTGTTTNGSAIITAIPSTATLQVGWVVTGTGIPSGSRISSVDSPSQVHISKIAMATNNGVSVTFGGTFSNPAQIFDFDPVANTISPVSPAIPDSSLAAKPAFVTHMLVLPTGQVLVNDFDANLWVYTPDGLPDPALLPLVTRVTYRGGGLFTLGGEQLNGQSAGSAYGDDAESDENFPILRLTNAGGQVFYARTSNWSNTGVATGSTPETVDFRLPPGMAPGNYSLQVIGAGLGSLPMSVNITAAELTGAAAIIPVRGTGDFDGDGKTDITVFRPSSGIWYTRDSGKSTAAALAWGGGNDIAVPGDYDGDGKTDIAVFRPLNGTWYIRYSRSLEAAALAWGGGDDIPVPGDFDGDGITDLAVFRPSTGTWYIRYSATGISAALEWGGGNDVPVPRDYDGDGVTDVAVFRPSNGMWYIQYSATAAAVALAWGGGNDVPVPSDYDGDGKADIAVFRPSNGTWYVRYSASLTSATVAWGGRNDIPVPGDYDGDGLTDIAVFRPSSGTWYIRYSGRSTTDAIIWGGVGDVPILKRP